MQSKQYSNKQQRRLKKAAPQLYIIIGTLLIAALSYYLLFIYPKQVTFSYAEKTCVQQLTLLPSLQQQVEGDAPFAVSLEDKVTLGPLQLASTSICFAPTADLADTTAVVRVSPLAGPLFAKQFAVSVPKAPEVVASAAEQGKVSAVRPLEIKLDTQDIIHTYTLAGQGKRASCTSSAVVLRCDTAALSLEHGKDYALQLTRQITGITEVEPVKDFAITTLTPVNITTTSVASAQVVYDTPKDFGFTTDKALSSAKATLAILKGETATPVEVKIEVRGTNGRVTLDAPLERKSQYILTITELNGEDGSSLAEAYSVRFATSGGPKVTGASVGSSLVPQNARIILTFDQAIDDTVDVVKFIKLTGVPGAVTKQNATQVAVTVQNAPLCTSFAITVDKGMKSGANGSLGEDTWKLDSRIICGTSSTIGYSVRGRAITAYYFGAGSSTILFTGGIHGSEGSSTTTMQAWVTYLQSNGHKIPADKRVVVVPNTNPDAIAAGSRNNVNNVNIARNFPTANWKSDIETANGILVNGGGTSATSEPEAKALASLTRQLRPRLEVSFHAQGKLVGANKVGDSVSIGAIYAGLVGYQTMFYNAEAVMGYEMTGEYEDWMGEEMGIPAILIELPGYSGNYLNSQLTALLRMLSV